MTPHSVLDDIGSISARAEEPLNRLSLLSYRRVDLRAGGGAQAPGIAAIFETGRSPRGRRSRLLLSQIGRMRGSISARAEEPRSARAVSFNQPVDLRAGGGAH